MKYTKLLFMLFVSFILTRKNKLSRSKNKFNPAQIFLKKTTFDSETLESGKDLFNLQ
jgi:hypothetical protein